MLIAKHCGFVDLWICIGTLPTHAPFLIWKLHTKTPFVVLFPFMLIERLTLLTSNFFEPQNNFSHFFSSDQFDLKKSTQEKTVVPKILNSQKIKQELGDLLGPIILLGENWF